ncbi:MAG TPA: LTA synthase family protein [Puia sp.]|nr:LTA synthase family protein [Puia sp.]
MGILLLLYAMTRLVFWWYNHRQFPGIGFHEGLMIFLRGLQQDLVTVILVNSPVLCLSAIAAYLRPDHFLRRGLIVISRWLFTGLNAAGIALNILDVGYFQFSRHRSNLDLLYVFSDSLGSFKSVLAGYWLLLLFFTGTLFILIRTARNAIPGNRPAGKVALSASSVHTQAASRPRLALYQLLVLTAAMLITGALPRRFVLPSTPLLSLNAADLPLAQNSAFTFMYSVLRKQHQLKPVNYFPAQELASIVSTSHNMGKDGDTLQRKNVVICILESFSRCYLTPGDPMKANTPFFDSLIGKSMYFPNAHANGYTSNQGIVAILAGLPSFLDEPFFYSEYANTPLRSIGNILKEKGYDTNFFLGAGKDHFGFGKFTHMAGIDHYYSRSDFNDDRAYDGNWGIFDEPFLRFGARVLAGKPTPFLAVFFNISSHPPFTIPPQYRERFNYPDQTPAQRSISYTDHSFQTFFADCSKAPWFRNSIFVFCADHWLDPYNKKKPYNFVNPTSIPIFIYDPSRDGAVVNNTLAAQVDLTPTILELLHYKGSYTGMGKSLLDSATANNYSVIRNGDLYLIITKDFVLGYDLLREKSRFLYRHSGDDVEMNDLLEEDAQWGARTRLERLLKANIQCYDQALTRRSLE